MRGGSLTVIFALIQALKTERFLEKNGFSFDYDAVEAYQFRKELYTRRLQEYGTYEERPISILKEADNQVFSLCLEFVNEHIR